jgi:membrane protease YdiL (CAAX protease family)
MSHPVPDVAVTPQPLAVQPLDIQHDTDPADDHGPARRIPHLGHAVLFFLLAFFFVVASLSAGVGVVSHVRHISRQSAASYHPLALLAAQGAGYVLTLLFSAWLFSRLWERPFLTGIEWNTLALRRRWFWLLPLGLVLSGAAQYALHFIPTGGGAPIENLFTSQRSVWATAGMAILLGPLFEEIAFRGFLLPALATAYDWLAMERTPAGLERWRNSALHSRSGLVFAAVISSVPFALMHAAQISFVWGAVGVLYCVSLALSYIRIRTHSVACSTLVHGTYNLTIFAVIYIATGGFRHLDRFLK